MKKRIWSLASFLCLSLFTASVAFAAEAPTSNIPQNLRIPALSADEHSITLIWEKPIKYENISGYHIYMNGKMLGDAEQNQESEASRQMKDFYQTNAVVRQEIHPFLYSCSRKAFERSARNRFGIGQESSHFRRCGRSNR